MQKKTFHITVLSAIVVCAICLFIKSFTALHYESEINGGKMTVVLKANPLGNNIVFEDKDEARHFLINSPESYAGNSLFDFVFKIPIPIYLFILLLLVSVYIKRKNPTLKKRWMIISIITVPLFVWIIWLFQTHSPTEKVYTSDRQFSYYLEEYNYNVILKRVFGGFLHETEYKVFVYDEIIGEKLYSGYAGGKTVLRDYFGFVEKDDEFHLTKPDYITLPRPIDAKAIEQVIKRERAVRDSIRWAHEKKEAKRKFYELPAITPEEIAYIQPVIKKWTGHYEIDLSQARFREINTRYFNSPPDTAGVYYLDFRPEDNSSARVEMSYSPNKQLYVDIGVLPENVDGKYYDSGEYDVDQAVYLIDRKQRHKNILFFNGPSVHVQDVFWKNNDVFITVGVEIYGSANKYVIHIFNLTDNTQKQYELLTNKNPHSSSYFNEYLKKHGILPMRK